MASQAVAANRSRRLLATRWSGERTRSTLMRQWTNFGVVEWRVLTEVSSLRWRIFGGGGRLWEAGGGVKTGVGEVGDRHVGKAKLIDRWKRPAPEMHSRRMKNSASATLASWQPKARGRLLPWGGRFAHEDRGPGCLDTEVDRWRPLGGIARLLAKQKWSLVEEQQRDAMAMKGTGVGLSSRLRSGYGRRSRARWR
jgi:hypothetical protein